MLAYRVYDLVGPLCITEADGLKVYQAVRDDIVAGRSAVLDFSGVCAYSDRFVRASIGQIIRETSAEQVLDLVTLVVTDPAGKDLTAKVVELMSKLQYNACGQAI